MILTDEQQESFLLEAVFYEYGEILQVTWKTIKDKYYQGSELSEDQINECFSEVINNYFLSWKGWQDILSEDESDALRKTIGSKYRKQIKERITYAFEKFHLSRTTQRKLFQIALYKITKYEEPLGKSAPYTGIVISGYGNDDLYPVCVNYHIFGYICDKLIYRKVGLTKIGLSSLTNIAALLPFGQDDVVRNIMNGRLPLYEEQLSTQLLKKFPEMDVNEVLNKTNAIVDNSHTQPIIDTIAVLPKDELASVAKNLVNLTSFMRRVSSDMETVGGPVDVAVISKKDGFIWIDRKHYFELSKNMQYPCNKRSDNASN